MAVVRITKDLRKTIVVRALDDAFKKRKEEMMAVENELALRARTHVFGADLLAKVDSLPDGWSDITLHMKFNCGGPVIRLSFERTQRIRQSGQYNSHSIYDETLRMEILAFADKRKTLRTEEEAASTALDTLIIKCSTVKILQERWPEGREYYKDLQPAQLPAVRTDDVNRLLGLPK